MLVIEHKGINFGEIGISMLKRISNKRLFWLISHVYLKVYNERLLHDTCLHDPA